MNFKFSSIFPVTCHTKHVGPGSTFVAIPGQNQHGQEFIPEALAKGAITIVVDSTFTAKKNPNVTYLHVDDAHRALSKLAAEALGYPSEKLYIIGVTGTKGKTSTGSLIFHLLQTVGIKAALISSVENKIGDIFCEKSSLTTPTADYIQMFCSQAVKEGTTHLIIETSSHALFYKKLADISLDLALFTNFNQDHLDFHKTMNHYFETKLKIFSLLKPTGKALINNNDSSTTIIRQHLQKKYPHIKLKTIGTDKKSDKQYRVIKTTLQKTSLKMSKSVFSSQYLNGYFNAQNIALAIAAAHQMQISNQQIKMGIKTFPGVEGRVEKIKIQNDKHVIIDFAHNPSSMESILSSLAQQTNQLIVLFGCGGNRDALKRSLMGSIAAQYGTIVIVTNDNPRHESPDKIIQEIVTGIDKKKLANIILEPDRRTAIQKGLMLLEPDGILAILGRGHETDQLMGSKKIPFHDATVVAELSHLT